jgi:hypothetical protein
MFGLAGANALNAAIASAAAGNDAVDGGTGPDRRTTDARDASV